MCFYIVFFPSFPLLIVAFPSGRYKQFLYSDVCPFLLVGGRTTSWVLAVSGCAGALWPSSDPVMSLPTLCFLIFFTDLFIYLSCILCMSEEGKRLHYWWLWPFRIQILWKYSLKPWAISPDNPLGFLKNYFIVLILYVLLCMWELGGVVEHFTCAGWDVLHWRPNGVPYLGYEDALRIESELPLLFIGYLGWSFVL